MVSLLDLGFDPARMAAIEPMGMIAGRISEEQKGGFRVLTEVGPRWARPSGRLSHQAGGREDLPVVGDFVLLRADTVASEGWTQIEQVLPRRTLLQRKAAGTAAAMQMIAANVDSVFIVSSLNQDLNERRLERYLLAVWDSGAVPVIVLSKADIGDEAAARQRLESISGGVPVVAVSTVSGLGMACLAEHLGSGKTGVFVGSSGVGKSTLINHLMQGNVLATQGIRDGDDRGRHTTTARSLWLLPQGGIIIDTPGMREFMPAVDGEAMDVTFADVEAWTTACRFTNCSHRNEPGCGVQTAIADGTLAADRYAAFAKLQREQAYLARKQDARLAARERQRWKAIAKEARQRRPWQKG